MVAATVQANPHGVAEPHWQRGGSGEPGEDIPGPELRGPRGLPDDDRGTEHGAAVNVQQRWWQMWTGRRARAPAG